MLIIRSRGGSDAEQLREKAFNHHDGRLVIPFEYIKTNRSVSNDQHVVQDIENILKSYYEVNHKTFVDSVIKQSVIHHLVDSADGPLALFSPLFVSQMSPLAIEEIAGEEPRVKRTRAKLHKEIKSLEEAKDILLKS
jgi:hypothetical protein